MFIKKAILQKKTRSDSTNEHVYYENKNVNIINQNINSKINVFYDNLSEYNERNLAVNMQVVKQLK